MDPRIQIPSQKSKINTKKAMSFLLPLGIVGILFLSLVFYYSYQLKYGDMDTIPENLKSDAFTEGKALKNTNNVAITDEVSIRPFNPTFGNKNAKITLVSFIDFECPYSQASYPILRSIMEKHQNDIYFVFKHLPIEDLHPNSYEATLAASCAYG
ncbi:MAG: thioredoxin domain-containing protein, partial [Candidatus Magasanikbacteria bacterium]